MTFSELFERQSAMYQRCLEYLERNHSGTEEQEKLRQKLKVMSWVVDDLEHSAKKYGMIPGSGEGGKLDFPADLPKYQVEEVKAQIEKIRAAEAKWTVEPRNEADKLEPEQRNAQMAMFVAMFGSMLRK